MMQKSIYTLLPLLFITILGFGSGCKKSEHAHHEGHENEGESHEQTIKEEETAPLTIYSGRKEEMMQPIFDKFEEKTGIKVKVQYGKSEELAATVIEEGEKSPADVFFSQDAGTLGWLSGQKKFTPIPQKDLDVVPTEFRSEAGDWVGTSGRARVLAYNTEQLTEDQLPKNVDELLDPKWKGGKIGWAPENASFKAFVAAMIAERGVDATKDWLQKMVQQEPKAFPSNTPLVTAIGKNELLIGLTNHYYLYRLKQEYGKDFPANNAYFKNGKSESMINSAGVGILKTSKNKDTAKKFVEFMLSPETQTYFANQTHEFPVIASVKTADDLPPIDTLNAPKIPQDVLKNLETTDTLLHEVGALN